jgi:uncharacterized protein
VLVSGGHNQVEVPSFFLTKPQARHLPLSSRRDVVVFRTPPLSEDLDVSGMAIVVLYVSSSCPDTDFTAKLIDEYPRSLDYPNGFALNLTHGIVRCRFRNSREKAVRIRPDAMPCNAMHANGAPADFHSTRLTDLSLPVMCVVCL